MMTINNKRLNIHWHDTWLEHGRPLLLFALLTLAVTWPAVRNFNTLIVSDGGDASNNLWMLWHVKEAFLGNHPWFELDLLYYPLGVNLLTRGFGPLVGILALPFWLWGAEAAYNGAMFLSVWLTGYTMYLLARTLNFGRLLSIFAGLFLFSAPIHLAGINGHMTKAFMAMLPLVLLAFLRLLDLQRSRWWAAVTAVTLLLTLLHNGYQFIFACLAITFLGLAAFLRAEPEKRWPLIVRAAQLSLAVLFIVGPLVLAMVRASANPLVSIGASEQSMAFQPDLTEFLLPVQYNFFFGSLTDRLLIARGHQPAIETAVSLSLTGLALCLIALFHTRKQAQVWLLFTILCIILAAGPALKLLGKQTFTQYQLPIILPYAFLTSLPGLDFMRTPGRFMMIGYVTMAVAATYGLSWLMARYARFAPHIIILASFLLLVERWPRPWPQEKMPLTPAFYQQIAADPEVYGVFDLPTRPKEEDNHITYAAAYQMAQMVHQKGIASGYLARTYRTHPLFPCVIPEIVSPEDDVRVNGQPADCAANILFDLAYLDYRYVVLHKPGPDNWRDFPNSWGQEKAAQFIERFFGGLPSVDDERVTVYAVPSLDEVEALEPTIGLMDNWYGAEAEWRWARSPATLFLSIPRPQTIFLELTPAFIYEPDGKSVLGDKGEVLLSVSNGYSTTLQLQGGQTTAVPLDLPAGVYTILLSLKAGSFNPTDYGTDDPRPLSFAFHTINLRTEPE